MTKMQGLRATKYFVLVVLISVFVTVCILTYGGLFEVLLSSKIREGSTTLKYLTELQAHFSHPAVKTTTEPRFWQACDDHGDVFVYSAYYREVEQDIRVVGLALKRERRTISCTFPDSPELQDVNASVKALPDNNRMPTIAILVSCSLKNKKSSLPKSVGIRVASRKVTVLKVIYPKPRQFNFTVCVTCLFGPYKNYYRLIETIETDRMFGADRFVITTCSISPEVDKVLQYYAQNGIVEIIPWNPPNVSHYYYAQRPQILDCVLSNNGRSKYVVVKDLDELIVPHIHKNWHDLMNFLDTGKRKNSTFLFQNSFFPLDWKEKQHRKPGSPQINSLTYIWRDFYFSDFNSKSKSIVRPDCVQVSGIHWTWEHSEGYTTHNVNHTIAYLHHYRIPYGTHIRKTKKDIRMLDFKDVLLQNINAIYVKLGLKYD